MHSKWLQIIPGLCMASLLVSFWGFASKRLKVLLDVEETCAVGMPWD